MKRLLLSSICLLCCVVLRCPPLVAGQGDAAEKVYVNGTVVTMAREGDVVEGVAIAKGKIVAVGSNAAVRALGGPSTEIVDLKGKTLLPGFYAAHDHFPAAGRVALYEVDLNSPPIGTVRTMDELVTALRAAASRTKPGEWVVGRGYDDTLLQEKRHPTRLDLDRATTEHPIWIVHTSGHLGVANSRALTLAGITKDTSKPAGGVIRKDATTGEPNGVIEEQTSLVGRLTPALSAEQRFETIRLSDRMYLSKGVTTTVIAGGGATSVPTLVEAYNKGLLHLRVLAMLAGGTGDPMTLEKSAALSPVPDRVRVSGVKLLQDGSLQGFTGYLTAPYHTQPEGKRGYVGYPSRSREQLRDRVLRYHRAGYQVAIHGNGDAAIDEILFAFREAQRELPRPDARHRIEHCQTARDDQLDTMRDLGVTPSFFVAHVFYWGDRHQDIFLGPERAARISPLAAAQQRNLHFTVHNDTPVTPVDPLHLVWCAATRLTKAGHVLGSEQRIGVYAALEAVTRDAAWQNFEERTKGSLETGKFADFIVLSENPLAVPPAHIRDIEILETIVGGQSVFKR